jgi:hypothetical protein
MRGERAGGTSRRNENDKEKKHKQKWHKRLITL